ncbi:MAG TPA: hypothetical protein VFL83_10845 [Anaeromyxobacter sp.]|nr:hypothetical protein [Anaeromyxobacter sp.]
MKDVASPELVAAANRVKEGVRDLARGAVGAAGDLASDLAQGYRKSTRYFKLRAAIVGTWALLSVVTLWAACPASDGPSNALGARVQLLSRKERGAIMGTQVYVENESRRMWKDVVLTLDGGWRYERRTVRPADKLVVSITQFRKDGAAAPPELEPRTLTIECEEGRVTAPLAAR